MNQTAKKTIPVDIEGICKAALEASRAMVTIDTETKNRALHKMADALVVGQNKIFQANGLDLSEGKKNGLSLAMLDRLKLDEKRISDIATGLLRIADLPDPVGEVTSMKTRPNGIRVGRMRMPLGVIGIIYESRPNVTADTSALCLKSGNAVILRGGSEAIHSNKLISSMLMDSASEAGIPENTIQIIPVTDRTVVSDLLSMDRYIDLVIPRGGYVLIRFVIENSTIPVIKHDKGVCHVYVHSDADINMATRIAVNAKIQRPGVCNAMETLLVHEDIASSFLPKVAAALEGGGVELRGCQRTLSILNNIKAAHEQDWEEEYLDLVLSIKVVESIENAMDHISTHGSGHTEAIVTSGFRPAQKFVARVDSSAVMVNTSTRFNDGGQFGLGAEIGISTQKLHARGPMGLEELTSHKFIVFGDGHIRQ